MARKTPSIFAALKDRRSRIETGLRRLGNVKFFQLRFEEDATASPFPRALLSGVVRIRSTPYYLHVWEDFRFLDVEPALYGFKYSVGPQDPLTESLFRYECHPDADDPTPLGDPGEDSGNWRNEYTYNPHFHPKIGLEFPIDHLHFLFHRSERSQIVFSIVGWLEVDLVKRFYDSGRVASV